MVTLLPAISIGGGLLLVALGAFMLLEQLEAHNIELETLRVCVRGQASDVVDVIPPPPGQTRKLKVP